MARPSDPHTLARIVHAGGGLLSINHDKPAIPWDYELPDADCMEVWQSAWPVWNWISLGAMAGTAGFRAAASPPSAAATSISPTASSPRGPLGLGRPTTVLWLPELSEDAVLAAMKAGRGYVTESPGGPHLAISADGAPMGGDHPAPAAIAAEARVRGAAGDTLVWVDASGPVRVEPDPRRRLAGPLSSAPRSASSAPRSSPRRAAAPSSTRFRRAVGDRPLPEGLTRGRPRRRTRSAAPSPTRSTSRPDPCSSATRPAPGASTTPTATASPPRPTSTRSPPPATAAPSSAPSASCRPTPRPSPTRSPPAASRCSAPPTSTPSATPRAAPALTATLRELAALLRDPGRPADRRHGRERLVPARTARASSTPPAGAA